MITTVNDYCKPKVADSLLTLVHMETLADRIASRLAELQRMHPEQKINPAWLARKVNLSSTSISKWMSGSTQELKGENLLKAAAALECTPEWLNSGKPPKSTGAADPGLIPDGASIVTYETVDELDPDRYVLVDRYDVQLSAGCGNIQWVINKKDPLSFRGRWFQVKRLDPKACKALYVRGRSMEPKLEDWDTVLIDTSQTQIVDGEIYAVCLEDEFYIKTLSRIPGGVKLISENPEFDTFEVTGEQLNRLRILGKKVWRGG